MKYHVQRDVIYKIIRRRINALIRSFLIISGYSIEAKISKSGKAHAPPSRRDLSGRDIYSYLFIQHTNCDRKVSYMK